MKKRKIGLFLLCFVAIITFGVFAIPRFNPRTITTDSGWDSDYDGGSSGSDWGGSSGSDSWDRDYSESSGSSSSKYTIYDLIAMIVFVILIVGFPTITFSKRGSSKDCITFENNDYYIPKFFKGYKTETFKEKLYQIFLDVQKAWMEFDYDQLSRLCTDELYQSYKSDLEVLQLKNGKNIMSDFHVIQSAVKNIVEENGMIIITFQLRVAFHDYVINTTNHRVIRGSKRNIMDNSYLLEYVVKKDNEKKLVKCPNCGAELKGRDCEYCNSHFNDGDYDIVLSKKSRM